MSSGSIARIDAGAPLLEVASLAKRYGDSAIFENVDLQVARGEFVAILGESGVGKSTLLNCIAGLDRIDAGSVRIDRIDVPSLPEPAQAAFRRDHLGFVFQAFHVLPHLSVAAMPDSRSGARSPASSAAHAWR
jgi:putative ABC transport system ATP-binding protein